MGIGRNNRSYMFILTPDEPTQTYQLKNVADMIGIEAISKLKVDGTWLIMASEGTASSVAQFKVKLENLEIMDNFVDINFFNPKHPRINNGLMQHPINRNAANITVEARNFDGIQDESEVHVIIHFDALTNVQ